MISKKTEQEIKDILSSFDASHVEGRTYIYRGSQYFIPYQTIMLQAEGDENITLISGLREMFDREKLLRSIFDQLKVKGKSYLDVGCNLAYFPCVFRDKFKKTAGIDGDVYYVNLAKRLYPDLQITFLDLNRQSLKTLPDAPFEVVTALSMIEYVHDRQSFVSDLFSITEKVCIVEGHSMDIPDGKDTYYEDLLKKEAWHVKRMPILTDAGINAPSQSPGRPLWVCTK